MKRLSIPRPVTRGYYNQWLNDPPKPFHETTAIAANDSREHDWDEWQGLEDAPRFGFTLGPRKTYPVHDYHDACTPLLKTEG